MNEYQISLSIASFTARIWEIHKTREFLDHLLKYHNYKSNLLPKFNCILIDEQKGGDTRRCDFPGIIDRSWIIDDLSLREMTEDTAMPDVNEMEGDFYVNPTISFCHDGNNVAIREHLGEVLLSRIVGKINIKDGDIQICDIKVLGSTWEMFRPEDINEKGGSWLSRLKYLIRFFKR